MLKSDFNYTNIVKNYSLDRQDIIHLKKVSILFKENLDSFLEGFYSFIFEFDHAKKFIKDDLTLNRHKDEISKWFLNLFSGEYDDNYFQKLYKISEVHIKIGLPHHYVNAAFSYVRRFLKNILLNKNMSEYINAVDKIIDINLDILTVTYSKGEQVKLIDDIVFIRNCIDNDLIVPFYQPIVDSKTLKISKYESLMRLTNPNTSEFLSIFPYLKTAKRIKIYEKLTKMMLEKVFLYMKGKNCEFSINLDFEDISNEQIIDLILSHIEKFDNPYYIIFEIVESEFIDDFKVVEEFAKSVRGFGCKIAIDDFGSGYSSMENILKLKPEIIKIDGTLIKEIDISKESEILVKNIVSMAKDMNAFTVAEYIHSKEVFEKIVSLEVDFLQGFYLAEPDKYVR